MDQSRQRLAHALLIELLSHQMAMPVKWIDTQDSLLSDVQVQRVVELGPSNTLTNMLKRTRASKYSEMDSSLGLDRKFLAASKDTADIYYESVESVLGDSPELNVKGRETGTVEPSSVTAVPSAISVTAQVLPTVTAAATKETPPAANKTMKDVPVAQLDTILALVASKLKKTMSQVSVSSTLSELSLGKSALQNELIGDVDAEFGTIPGQAESMSLSALSETLPQRQGGDFGKPVSRLLSRWFSAVMPNTFSAAAAREYLGQHWGLGKCRQSAVLLHACTQHPTSGQVRIDAVSDAKTLLDSAVTEYAQRHRMTLQPVSTLTVDAVSPIPSTNISPAVLAELTIRPKQLLEAQKRIIEEYLEESPKAEPEGVSDPAVEQLMQKKKLDLWLSEFGSDIEDGIQPKFSSLKVRHFNFSWNRARLELIKTYNTVVADFKNKKSTSRLPSRTDLKKLADQCGAHALTLTDQLQRDAEDKYGLHSLPVAFTKVMTGLITESLECGGPLCCLPEQSQATRPVTVVSEKGEATCKEMSYDPERKYADVVSNGAGRIRLLRKGTESVAEGEALTSMLYESIKTLISDGITFLGKKVLITGSGKGSIGLEITKGLLKGGATVMVTTSRDITEAQHFFRPIYAECGARGSELYVIPFNQGSITDCRDLTNYIFDELKLSVDVLVPLAAVPEQGIEIPQLGEKSELAHRMMMSNVLRLIGFLVAKNPNVGRMTQVLLPLSPNHGTFGGDGLYSESKLGLESLVERVTSESWGDRASIAGVRIGWTRGTGLMAANDVVAEAVESHGALTFTTGQMALNMLALLTPSVSELWDTEPVLADFSGGLKQISDLKEKISLAREAVRSESLTKQAIDKEDTLGAIVPPAQGHPSNKDSHQSTTLPKRSRFRLPFPKLPNYVEDLTSLAHLREMVDPTDTIVVVGYSELGPWGSSRTRWEMESKKSLSQEGYIEMAWMMGLIKHDSKGGWINAKTGQSIEDQQIPASFGKQILQGSGLRLIHPDSAQGYDPSRKEFLQQVVLEQDLPPFESANDTAQAFKLKHGDKVVLSRVDTETCRVQFKAGARIVIPKAVPEVRTTVAGMLPDNWDPCRYGIPDDIVNQVDPITLYALICASEAFLSAGIDDPWEVFRHIHISELGNFIGTSFTGLSKMRQIFLDTRMDESVASDLVAEAMGNSPAAWINLLLLGASGPIKTPTGACATSLESLDGGVESIRAGKTRMCLVGGVDPFQEEESYAFATLKATVDCEKQFAAGRQPDEMSRPSTETRGGFVDSAGGGALLICDAQLALDMGLPVYGIVAGTGMAADKIGRSIPAPGQGLLTFAREDPRTRESPLLDVEFRRRQMNAAIEGILYSQSMSLPMTPNSRSTSSVNDLVWPSDSSSAGQVSTSNSSLSSSPQPLKAVPLDDSEIDREGILSPSKTAPVPQGPRCAESVIQAQIRTIRRQWSTGIRSLEPGLSPMRAALAVWGLDINDISVASFHGTSTKANDLNEAETVNQQMSHLGRDGPPMLVISQKSVTGHGKAAAAAWMLNGCLQVLNTGLVPGNTVLDNVDPKLSRFEHVLYPTETIQAERGEIKAFLLSSFGFGQKGAQVVGVTARYFFATLDQTSYEKYADLCRKRQSVAHSSFAKRVLENNIVKVHDTPPYGHEEEAAVLLDPRVRAVSNEAGRTVYG